MEKFKKIHFGHLGQCGDQFLNLVAARSLKEIYPNCHITQPIAKLYECVEPLLRNNPYIDDTHIYFNYSDWPSQEDKDWLLNQNFDLIYNPMPQHKENDWWNYRHQAAEVCYMNNVPIPRDISIKLTQWFELGDRDKKAVSITPFGGNEDCEKRLTVEGAQKVVNFLNKIGYKVYHIAVGVDPILENSIRVEESYFGAVKKILETKCLISVDTGFTWCLSGYQHPVFATYFRNGVVKRVENIQPINPMGFYNDFEDRNFINWQKYFSELEDFLNNLN